MAKISPVSIKYTITADFSSEGPIEKPDVIGALFGQTEGLLGPEMELRELQKEGKIGRIDVNITTADGKTKGEIIIPSALDKTETTIIAAALETIDKIGPTDASISIKEIEDVRGNKREYIMERAKKLLGEIKNTGMGTKEMEQQLVESSRISRITSYGEENLPAGDLSEKEIIVVEGRADVVNLLRYGLKNVVGMNGTKFSRDITKLGEEKELTLFIDGDRGGKLIAKNVCDNANIRYIAVAPDGKEVEELSGKEIFQALRRKVSSKDFFKRSLEEAHPDTKTNNIIKKLTGSDFDKIKELETEIKARNVLVLNSNLEIMKNVPVSKIGFLRVKDAQVLVANTATSSLISSAKKLGVKYIAAKNFSKVEDNDIELISI